MHRVTEESHARSACTVLGISKDIEKAQGFEIDTAILTHDFGARHP